MSFVRYFISIVGGALASSVLGGIFACVVALVSPEFVSTLFGHAGTEGSVVRYAAGVGMIWGCFSERRRWASRCYSSLSSTSRE